MPPSDCWLKMTADVAYRNMFLFPCGSDIHFEFPVFEDHSYNTICNKKGLRNLIQRPPENRKFIIFRNSDQDIIGYYRIEKSYYQETKMFNNNGFVWGIEAEPYLIRRGTIKYDGPRLRQGFQASWHGGWERRLKEFLIRIQEEENICDLYQQETNRLINLFQSSADIGKWRIACKACKLRFDCKVSRKFSTYEKVHPNSDMFSALNNVYNSNLYSRNTLSKLPKIYIK